MGEAFSMCLGGRGFRIGNYCDMLLRQYWDRCCDIDKLYTGQINEVDDER